MALTHNLEVKVFNFVKMAMEGYDIDIKVKVTGYDLRPYSLGNCIRSKVSLD